MRLLFKFRGEKISIFLHSFSKIWTLVSDSPSRLPWRRGNPVEKKKKKKSSGPRGIGWGETLLSFPSSVTSVFANKVVKS